MKTLTGKLKEAEARAEQAEKQVKKLQKEVDRLEGIFTNILISITFDVGFIFQTNNKQYNNNIKNNNNSAKKIFCLNSNINLIAAALKKFYIY